MLASLEWLKQYVDIELPVEELVDRITRAGLEVETVQHLGTGLSGVVTGRVVDLWRHPNSDHLWVCMMDYGQGGEPVQILTGAQNVRKDDRVPVAVVGAVLPPSGRNPEGLKLKKARMRGLDSYGMLCSADELGIDSKLLLPEQRNGIYILPPDTPVGLDIKQVMGLDDTVLDIDLTSNRADCFSIIGLAREIAALTGARLRLPATDCREAAGGRAGDMAKIIIQDRELCPRFTVRVLKNIVVKPSPGWLQNRLRACGVRPISNVVDVTNYVMLELGQPMHAYDYDTVGGHTLIVRRAAPGEKLVTLDEQERKLDSSMITIGDATHAVGLGGVMGGLETEVTDKTVNVMLEAASFHGPSIRRTSYSLGLRSEASGRFERGVDTANCHRALNRAAYLLEEMGACETVAGIVEDYPQPAAPTRIEVTAKGISSRIGIAISKEEICRILTALEFQVEEEGERLLVTVPSWRGDCSCDADISEEVARFHGLDHIQSHLPVLSVTQGRQYVSEDVKDQIQDYLVGAGLSEIMSYSFINPAVFDKLLLAEADPRRQAIPLLNPITDDFKVMRTTMVPSLLGAAAYNLARQADRVAIFEIGRVFLPQALPLTAFPEERQVVAAALCGRRGELNWCADNGSVDFYDLKGIAEGLLAKLQVQDYQLAPVEEPYLHPGKSCAILLEGRRIGCLGELHPQAQAALDLPQKAYVLELELEPLIPYATAVPSYQRLTKHPASSRDMAVVVPQSVSKAELEAVIRRYAGELLQSVKVFDVYTGQQVPAGCKSMAFNLTYQAPDRTLTDEEVDASIKEVVEQVGEAYKAQLRH